MNDMIAFYNARLAERERRIRDVIAYLDRLAADDDDDESTNGGWELWGDFGRLIDPLIRPNDWLRDVEAKRRIMERYQEQVAKQGENAMEEDRAWMLEPIIRDLASVHDAHPDYDERWRP